MKTLYAMHDPMEKPRLATENDLRNNELVKDLISKAKYEEYLRWWYEYCDVGQEAPSFEDYKELRP